MNSQRIVLAADEAIGPRVANLVSGSAHELVAVVTPQPEDTAPRSLASMAGAIGVPCLDARLLNGEKLIDGITSTNPDVLLNVHSLTKVSSEVLECFPTGAWNLHPGPLPEAAGANVPSWAIALGWESHGVTVHRMTADYDDGEISFEDRFPISANATGLTLSAECSRRGLGLIKSLLDTLADDPQAIPSLPQDSSLRRYYGRKQPHDGQIAWTATAATIESYVRACDFRPFPSPWEFPQANIDGTWFDLLSVEIGEETQDPVGTVRTDGERRSVAAADRWITLTEVREVKK